MFCAILLLGLVISFIFKLRFIISQIYFLTFCWLVHFILFSSSIFSVCNLLSRWFVQCNFPVGDLYSAFRKYILIYRSLFAGHFQIAIHDLTNLFSHIVPIDFSFSFPSTFLVVICRLTKLLCAILLLNLVISFQCLVNIYIVICYSFFISHFQVVLQINFILRHSADGFSTLQIPIQLSVMIFLTRFGL